MRESYPDPQQFDSKAEYYDAGSSQENPRWFCVDVKLKRKLENPVFLKVLKEYAGSELATMPLFTMKRLSVQTVGVKEWDFILNTLVDE